ncbi:TIGR03086 family metal-binding protein [Actinomadura sp. WAC 06369]|uniref:TIGR03086 family metal-binding protein n=1 Tax=Actinomadura sp. WAC 06369 TaxID=2203193 RepID=UPI000F772769|nr:TIGR03086 family metal-binding protein [Actinomadura sp. WAC 06369]RSN68078.1 TIGR03086 family protein [Actinomadura sp. WAC 06369]
MIDLTPAVRELAALLDRVPDDRLAAPTPCAGFDVAALIDHVDEAARGFTAMAGREPAATGGADRRKAAAEHLRDLAEAWADPAAWRGDGDAGGGLVLPNETWGLVALTEAVVHGWDLATALGEPFDLPGETLRACFAHVAAFVPNAPLPELWGPAVEVPEDAPLIDRIVAVTGRTP